MKIDRADKFLIFYIPLSAFILLILGGIFALPNICSQYSCTHENWQIPATITLFFVVILIGTLIFWQLRRKTKKIDITKKNCLTLFLIFIVVIVLIASLFANLAITRLNKNTKQCPTIDFKLEGNNLIVVDYDKGRCSESEFIWNNIEIKKGNATLPSGTIDKGDIITNCSGEIVIIFKPTMEIIYQSTGF